jgi:hypothetical protein
MGHVLLEDDTHKRLKVVKAQHDDSSLSDTVDRLLDEHED